MWGQAASSNIARVGATLVVALFCAPRVLQGDHKGRPYIILRSGEWKGRVYPKSALLMASGVVGFSHRFTPAKRAGTALAS